MKKQKHAKNELSDKVARTEDSAAEQLVFKSPSFQWRVAMKVALICGVLVIIQGLFTNWWLAKRFTAYVVAADSDVSNRIFIAKQEITNRIVAEFELPRIREIVSDVASNRANAILTMQLLPEVNRFRESVSNEVLRVSKSIDDLTNASKFAMTLLAANANERAAFNVLRQWGENQNYRFHLEASRAWLTILDYHNITASDPNVHYYPPWGTNPDPLYSFDAVRDLFATTKLREQRMGILQQTMQRSDLSKFHKVALLVSVMHKEPDLQVLSLAGKLFRDQTGFNMKSLSTDEFFKWWDENHKNLDTNASFVSK